MKFLKQKPVLIIFVFWWSIFYSLPGLAIAESLNSTNYSVENPEFDAGGDPSSSTNYNSRDSIGSESGDNLDSTNYKIQPGFVPPSYPGVPAQPTLTNTGGSLYNSLDFIVATGDGQQTDTTYAIAISSDNFATTYYIQADDTLGTSPVWQTYVLWNSGTGERVTGLASSTTYQIKVKARYGTHSESAYSVAASASTAAPNLTFTIAGVSSGSSVAGETTSITTTATAISFGSLPISTNQIAAQTLTVTTNAVGGYTAYLSQDGNLRTSVGDQISAVSATNASPASFPTGVTTGRFGYHTTDSSLCTGTSNRFSVNDTYAGLTTSSEEVACNTGPASSEATSIVYKIVIGAQQQAGSYQNKLTYIATSTY